MNTYDNESTVCVEISIERLMIGSYKVNVLKFRTFFSSQNTCKMLVFRAVTHKMLVSTANRENPDQTASSETVLS